MCSSKVSEPKLTYNGVHYTNSRQQDGTTRSIIPTVVNKKCKARKTEHWGVTPTPTSGWNKKKVHEFILQPHPSTTIRVPTHTRTAIFFQKIKKGLCKSWFIYKALWLRMGRQPQTYPNHYYRTRDDICPASTPQELECRPRSGIHAANTRPSVTKLNKAVWHSSKS